MKEKVIEIIKNNNPDIDNIEDGDFIIRGVFDSFDIITLVAEFDKNFNISIDGSDIIPDNFDNIEAIINMLKKNGAQ